MRDVDVDELGGGWGGVPLLRLSIGCVADLIKSEKHLLNLVLVTFFSCSNEKHSLGSGREGCLDPTTCFSLSVPVADVD